MAGEQDIIIRPPDGELRSSYADSLRPSICRRLAGILESNGLPYLVVDHQRQFENNEDKQQWLGDHQQQLHPAFSKHGLLPWYVQDGRSIILSKTLTASMPGIPYPFLITVLGGPKITIDEQHAALHAVDTMIDVISAGRREVKSIRLGARSEAKVADYGFGPGYIGPFTDAPIPSVFIERSAEVMQVGRGTQHIVDLALSPWESLFMIQQHFLTCFDMFVRSLNRPLLHVTSPENFKLEARQDRRHEP